MQLKELAKEFIHVSIRIEPGEQLVSNLEKFARDSQASYVWVNSIGGGFRKVKYCFSVGFDVGYRPIEEVEGPLELLSIMGPIAWDHDDPTKPMVHLHATLNGVNKNGDKIENVIGGHYIGEAEVDLTVEVFLTVFFDKEKVTRKLDERVNVKLLNFPPYSTSQVNSLKERAGNWLKELKDELKKEIVEDLKKELGGKLTSNLQEQVVELNKALLGANKTNAELNQQVTNLNQQQASIVQVKPPSIPTLGP